MTKEQLLQYRSLKAEIAELTAEINMKESSAIVKGSDTEFPFTQHNIKVCQSGESTEALHKKRMKCRAECMEITAYIDSIDDSLLRRIFRLRYLKGKDRPSWQQIAFTIGEYDESYPRHKHNRYLRKSNKKRGA